MFGAGECSWASDYIKSLWTAWRQSCRPDSRGALRVAGYSAASVINRAPHAVSVSRLKGLRFETHKHTSSNLQLKKIAIKTNRAAHITWSDNHKNSSVKFNKFLQHMDDMLKGVCWSLFSARLCIILDLHLYKVCPPGKSLHSICALSWVNPSLPVEYLET